MPDLTIRRPKRFLTAEQKYEIWLKLLTGELTSGQAAVEARVDRSTIMTLRKTARDGAMAALQASQRGRRPGGTPPRRPSSEAVKQFETSSSHRLVMSASGVGSLIQATVGSWGGAGRRCPKRAGLAA